MIIKQLKTFLIVALLLTLSACGGGGGGGDTPSTVDTTIPTMATFTLPATSNSLTVPINNFIATDNVGVTGYCLVESDDSSGCTWSPSSPANYTFAAAGIKDLYAFAKDAAGNISSSLSAVTEISLPRTARLTVGIQRKDTIQGTNIGSVDLRVTLPISFVLETDTNGIPISTTPLVTGLNVQDGLNYTHPLLILSLYKEDATVFSTGELVSFTRTLGNGEMLPQSSEFTPELIYVSESPDDINVLDKTADYELTLSIEEI